ncbi:5-formyltetrahydrofolate cyclo-ligase [Clostridium sp. BJN0001]|uniref:5-formyltetrahydrofolate cyclo-ligase n=1 Tax=Clostridium sp. BJN0001 TaxID=2930219 RepID=UPI001FD3D66B|nr:5-formyltetrahydrofolate cyclo-ligase [Clostridium sp. BJN0001]
MDIKEQKHQIRHEILKIRNNLNSEQKERADEIIRKKFLSSDTYIKSSKIFIYISYGSEIDTKEIIKTALKDGKEIFIPRTDIKKKVMDAVRIKDFKNLTKDKYGILEPASNIKAADPDIFDLIVVPGVAFDNKGGRIGYGGGYYDKYLKCISKPVKKVSLSYKFQMLDKINIEKHDLLIDTLITD